MKPNEPVEVVIRPEDLCITLPEEASSKSKLIPSFSVGFITRLSPMTSLEMNGWSTRLVRPLLGGNRSGLWTRRYPHHASQRNRRRVRCSYRGALEIEEQAPGLINAIEEEEMKKTTSKLFVVPYMLWIVPLCSRALSHDFRSILFQHWRPILAWKTINPPLRHKILTYLKMSLTRVPLCRNCDQ